MEENTDGENLLRRFELGGFDEVLGSELPELADYLEQRALQTGLVAPQFIAEAIRAVANLFKEHDESGGIRAGFFRKISEFVRAELPKVRDLSHDPLQAAQVARNCRDQILSEVTGYDVRKTYE